MRMKINPELIGDTVDMKLRSPDCYTALQYLDMTQGAAVFEVTGDLHRDVPPGDWRRARFDEAIVRLIKAGHLVRIR